MQQMAHGPSLSRFFKKMKNFKYLSKATLLRNMAQRIKRRAFAESATTNALQGPSDRVSGGDNLTIPSQTCCSMIRLAGIESYKKDRYGRTISTLQLITHDVKLPMLQTASAAAAHAQSETKARNQGVDVGQFNMSIPPCEWRHIRANVTKNAHSKS
jgi:hypothetical protein